LWTRSRYVDYMLLMTYNYHGNWNEFTGHHSAVFPRSDELDAERQWNQVISIQAGPKMAPFLYTL